MVARYSVDGEKMKRLIISTLILVAAYSVAGSSTDITHPFNQKDYSLQFDRFSYDNWGEMPPAGWNASTADDQGIRLGSRLPFDWISEYKDEYEQHFQPSLFYKNSAAICNFAKKNPDRRAALGRLHRDLFDRMMEFATWDGSKLYIRSEFEFPVYNGKLNKGWVSGIVNGFGIAGILKAQECFKDPEYATVLQGLVESYKSMHVSGKTPPERWISFIDDDGYLWFEEYPMPNGEANRILNGHIFALFGLILYEKRTGDESVRPLINGGLKTIEDNILKFRRKNKINSYGLRSPNQADYGPIRTVKQQCQLYALTKIPFFRNVASTFRKDFKVVGIEAPVYATEQCQD